jgi:hypothetical protein
MEAKNLKRQQKVKMTVILRFVFLYSSYRYNLTYLPVLPQKQVLEQEQCWEKLQGLFQTLEVSSK